MHAFCGKAGYPGRSRSGFLSAALRGGMIALFSCGLTVPGIARQNRQLPQDTVARIGDEAIMASDLLRRIELMPFPDVGKKLREDDVRKKSLYAMIAEKMLANEAKRRHLPDDETTIRMRRELENLFIRDELFKREIEQKAIPDPAVLQEAVHRFEKELTVVCSLVRSQKDGEALTKLLRSVPYPADGNAQYRRLVTDFDTVKIHFDGPDSALERTAYTMDRTMVSDPVFSDSLGWAVLNLVDVGPYGPSEKMDLGGRYQHVEKIVKRRLEMEMQERYAREVLATRTAQGDSTVFDLFADSLLAMWKVSPEHFRRNGGYIVTEDMVDALLDELGPFLGRTMVHIDDGDLTLGAVLEMMRYENFTCSDYEGFRAKEELNEEVRHVVGRELLAREGRRQNLQFSKNVQTELAEWNDYWAARRLFYDVRDSIRINDEDVLQHLIRNVASFGESYEVNVREILCKDLVQATEVLRALHEGKTMEDLAARYSMRPVWNARGGESRFFPVKEHPELGFRALMALQGVLQGPVRLDGGFSLFTVLGTRRTSRALAGFDTLRQNISVRLLNEKRKATLDRFLSGLARAQQVNVDEEALQRVHPTLVPMFTRRYMGFGGMMSGAPILMRQWDWYEEYKNATIPLP